MNYYELSMLDDVIDSTAQTAEQAERLNRIACSPKWFVTAAHSAAQGAMSCYLNQGNGIASWRERDAKAWLKAHDEQRADETLNREYPEVRLNYFMELYADVKRTAKANHDESLTVVLTEEVDHWIGALNQLRNSFIHFQTNHHLVSKEHVICVVQSAATTVKALSDSQSFPWWWSDEAEHSRSLLKEHLQTLDSALSNLAAAEADTKSSGH